MKFSDFERAQATAIKVKEEADLECVSCRGCGCQWFEQITLFRFAVNHNLVLGQEVPPKPGSMGYKFMKCVQCNQIIEPRVQHYARDLAASDYDYLLDTLEGKHDNRKKEEKEEVKTDEIQSEEL